MFPNEFDVHFEDDFVGNIDDNYHYNRYLDRFVMMNWIVVHRLLIHNYYFEKIIF